MKEIWDIPEKEEILHTGPEWLFDLLVTLDDDTRVRVLMIIWRNWHNRNEVIHGKKEAPLEASRLFLQSYVDSLMHLEAKDGKDLLKGKSVIDGNFRKKRRGKNVQKLEVSKWPKPPDGWLAVSVDASYDPGLGMAGTAAVIRDTRGDFVLASCKFHSHCRDALEAEALAFREGIGMALVYTAQPLVIQTDCANLAKVVKQGTMDRSHIGHLVKDIKESVGGGRELVIEVIKRTNNRVADRLAYLSRAEHQTDLWLQDAPDALTDLLAADCNPISD